MRRFFSDRPAFYLALFTLCWAIIEFLGASVKVTAYQVVWTRYGVHLACLLLLVAPRHGRALGRTLTYTPRLGRQIVRSLLMLMMPISFVWALYRMSPHNAWSVFWVAPLLVMAIASLTSERVATLRTVAAGVCGLIGAWLIDKPDAGVFQPAAFFALTMAASLALYMVMTRSMRDEPVLPKLFHTAVWVFVALTLALPLFWRHPSPESLLAMVAIGVVGLVALFALDRAIDAMPPALLAPVLYTELAWDVLLHWHQHVGGRTSLGIVLILIAVAPALAWRSKHATAVAGVTA